MKRGGKGRAAETMMQSRIVWKKNKGKKERHMTKQKQRNGRKETGKGKKEGKLRDGGKEGSLRIGGREGRLRAVGKEQRLRHTSKEVESSWRRREEGCKDGEYIERNMKGMKCGKRKREVTGGIERKGEEGEEERRHGWRKMKGSWEGVCGRDGGIREGQGESGMVRKGLRGKREVMQGVENKKFKRRVGGVKSSLACSVHTAVIEL